MKMIEIKRQLLEEILDQLKGAQQDCYVESTEMIIDEVKVVLRQPDVIKSVCDHRNYRAGHSPFVPCICNDCGEEL